MKTFITMISFVMLAAVAFGQTDKSAVTADEAKEKIELAWSENTHDFSEIPVGDPVTAKFEFTNKGKEPLTVTKVRSSCGCTVANYSKDPVLPGKKGEVSATYNAAKQGPFHKSVTVYTSDGSQYRLSLKGKVVKNDE